MSSSNPIVFLVTGTDTDVGKTYCAALLARRWKHSGLRVAVYKPVASGCRREADQLVATDAVQLWNAAGRPRTLDDVCPQRFAAALAPPEAAAAESRRVNADQLRDGFRCWDSADYDVAIIEGAGGLLSPLADGVLNVDLFLQFHSQREAKWIVISANRLGTIHQTLATCEAAQRRGVQPTGIILCNSAPQLDDSAPSNAEQIHRYSDVPLLGTVGYQATAESIGFVDPLLEPSPS